MEESRFTMNGAFLVMRPEGLTMLATDSRIRSRARPHFFASQDGSSWLLSDTMQPISMTSCRFGRRRLG